MFALGAERKRSQCKESDLRIPEDPHTMYSIGTAISASGQERKEKQNSAVKRRNEHDNNVCHEA